MPCEIQWARYPHVRENLHARNWLTFLWNLGRAENTLKAYGSALENHLWFCKSRGLEPEAIGPDGIAMWIRTLLDGNHRQTDNQARRLPLSNATIQQNIVAVRSFYDQLLEDGLRATNPVRRGQYGSNGNTPRRGLLNRVAKVPWIPNEYGWERLLECSRAETIRNRLRIAMAYDGALRREELVRIDVDDLEPAYSLIHLRAETTKGRRAREVMYGASTASLLVMYMHQRTAAFGRTPGSLFRSESTRNRGKPISLWTWSKTVQSIATRAGVPKFSTHSFRHLRLTDLARAGWSIEEIAQYAGHRDLQTTLMYIHLSGRELAAKFRRTMDSLHTRREKLLSGLLE
jgi:site-specific recombinase XerD